MSSALAPLPLPGSDDYPAADAAGYLLWLDDRCDGQLARARELLATLRSGDLGDADAVMQAWNDVNIALRSALAIASFVTNVHPDEEVRDRAERAEQEGQRLVVEIGLDRGLYEALGGIDPDALDPMGRRMLSLSLRDFRRAGVDRDDEARARIRELADRITETSQDFARNIREAGRSVFVSPDQLVSLPDDFVDAHPPGADGRVELSTEYPDYVPVITFCADRDVRRRMVEAYLDRAWPENDAVLHRLLDLRREQAHLLGYADWADYDAEVKMIGQGGAIQDFVDRVAAIAEKPGRRDFDVVLERMRQDHPDATEITTVDKAYYSELVRKERFDVDAQQVRQYFDFTRVRDGLLDVTGRLFDLDYVEVRDAPRWHPDVAVYDVHQGDQAIGRIYLDLHPRTGKYNHAAQFDMAPGVSGRQLAEGVLVCNLPRGLMDHDDVVTLFHEFGHLVHHVLGGRQEWVRFSGVATEWDFVEAPSQMLEEWAWDAEILQSFGTDEGGRPIPEQLVQRMVTANEFGKASDACTQMFYAATSYVLHHDPPDDLTATVERLQRAYDVFSHLPGTHFHARFGHLTDYASGYYTYMWSLVIAKDLFSAFDRDNLLDTAVAHRYRDTILVPGGSKDAAELVEDFLGRPYSFEAFRAWLAT